MQKCFVLDLDLCTGCHACQLGCKIENQLAPGMSWRQVITFNESHLPGIPLFSLPLACNHCIDAPCKEFCPGLAYEKDRTTGGVTVNDRLCMGCRYCLWVCPYDAPKFNPSTGVVEKCTFCSHRLKEGSEPACTESCPTGALRIGDYSESEEPGKDSIPGFWRKNIEPAIRIKPLRRGAQAPQIASSEAGPASEAEPRGSAPRTVPKVSLRSEWPLFLLTMAASILVALFHTRILVGFPLDPRFFTAAGAAAIGVSMMHLGRRLRFYRAVLNWRRSWVSREVVLFTAFLAGAAYSLFAAPGEIAVARAVSALGFAALFAMDKVYQIRTNLSRSALHSASVLLTGLYLVGVLSRQIWFIFPLSLVKLILYLLRVIPGLPTATPRRRLAVTLRLATGYLAPLILWLATGTSHYSWIAVSILAGEIVDRIQFYAELDFTSPSLQAKVDLDRMIAATAPRTENSFN